MNEELKLTAALQAASDVPSIHSACRDIARWMGFDHFLYAVRVPVSLTQPYHFCLSGYPRAWRTRYDELGYLRVDPIIAHAFSTAMPLIWDEIDRRGAATLRFLDEARSYGLAHGATAPVYGRHGEIGLLSMARSTPLSQDPGERARLKSRIHWFGTLVHESVRKNVLTPEGAPVVRMPLTPREKDCLMWAADGKTSAEIARCLSISERTVHFHIDNAGQKLGVQGRHSIIARAVALGEIELNHHALKAVPNIPVTHETTN